MIELQRGQVVRSMAGHDKGEFLVVLSSEYPFALVCDGKRRTLLHPKNKKHIHLSPTTTVLAEDTMTTDRAIRRALRFASTTEMEVFQCQNRT